MMDAGQTLMLSTDYPHWDFDDPLGRLPGVPAPQAAHLPRHRRSSRRGSLLPRLLLGPMSTMPHPTPGPDAAPARAPRLPEREDPRHGRQRHVVASVGDLPAGRRKIVRVGGREIGVFHTPAGSSPCATSAPTGRPPVPGPVTGTTLPSAPGEYVWGLEGRVLRCPWHGWEFDLETGVGLYDPYRHERVASYEVRVESDEVVLYA